MNIIDNRIHLLDSISQSKIQSSVQILSLNDVVLELIKNALDAQATHIKIVLNYAQGFCSVIDDGYGISAREFEKHGGLAKPFRTSKLGQSHRAYGRHGRYLATLAGLSLLSIASRVDGGDTHVLWLDNSGHLRHVIESPDTLDLDTGTRVKVYGLFSKLPVRSKSQGDRYANALEIQKDFTKLKDMILGLILASTQAFSINLRHASPKHSYQHKAYHEHTSSSAIPPRERLSSFHSAIRQAGYVESPQANEWQETSVQSGNTRLRGFISKSPVPHKLAQYLCLNHFPLTRHSHIDLFQRINALFEQSSFGSIARTDAECSDDNRYRQRRRGCVKGVDKWPMFVIWIVTTPDSVQDLVHDSVMQVGAQRLLAHITDLLQTLVEEFLITHEYVLPHAKRQLRRCEASKDTSQKGLNSAMARGDQFNEPFRHWSRIKSTKMSALDNFLTGLPFHQKSKNDQSNASSPVSEASLSAKVNFDTTIVADVPNDSSASTLSQNRTIDRDFVLWTDPQTGRPLRIDARTGIVLPETFVTTDAQAANIDQRRFGRSVRRSISLDVPSSRQEESPDFSLTQLARNIRNYSKGRPSFQDEPVRSIALSTYDSKDPEGHFRSRRRNTELFWADTDIFADYPTQPEKPVISKQDLHTARVLRQVDKKFILILVQEEQVRDRACRKSNAQVVLIDQHAADERCKVEALFRSLREDQAVTLIKPITFEVPIKEARLLDAARSYFAQWNILYESPGIVLDEDTTDGSLRRVAITGLPSVIAERCRLHPKFAIEILREEIWSDANNFGPTMTGLARMPQGARRVHGSVTADHSECLPQSAGHEPAFGAHLPPRLLEMVNSRACRSAIMFNDKLGIEQCQRLVKKLSTCTLPFQCAHGRPSMVALANLNSMPCHNPLAPISNPTNAAFTARSHGNRTHSLKTAISDENHSCPRNNIDQDGQPRSRTSLNTIEENTTSFGQAYRLWTEPRPEP